MPWHGALADFQTMCRFCTQPHVVPARMLMWQTPKGLSNVLVVPCRVVGVSVAMWLIVLVCVLISGPIGDSCSGILKMVLPVDRACLDRPNTTS